MTRKNTAAISGKCIAVYVCNFQGPWQVHPKKTQVQEDIHAALQFPMVDMNINIINIVFPFLSEDFENCLNISNSMKGYEKFFQLHLVKRSGNFQSYP